MFNFDFCHSVICALNSEEPRDDEFCKLLLLVSMYNFIWVNEKTNTIIIDFMLERLVSSKKHSMENMEQISKEIEKHFLDDPETIRFVRASRILFHTYNDTGRLFQLRKKLIYKNKRFMQQFNDIKNGIVDNNLETK